MAAETEMPNMRMTTTILAAGGRRPQCFRPQLKTARSRSSIQSIRRATHSDSAANKAPAMKKNGIAGPGITAKTQPIVNATNAAETRITRDIVLALDFDCRARR